MSVRITLGRVYGHCLAVGRNRFILLQTLHGAHSRGYFGLSAGGRHAHKSRHRGGQIVEPIRITTHEEFHVLMQGKDGCIRAVRVYTPKPYDIATLIVEKPGKSDKTTGVARVHVTDPAIGVAKENVSVISVRVHAEEAKTFGDEELAFRSPINSRDYGLARNAGERNWRACAVAGQHVHFIGRNVLHRGERAAVSGDGHVDMVIDVADDRAEFAFRVRNDRNLGLE